MAWLPKILQTLAFSSLWVAAAACALCAAAGRAMAIEVAPAVMGLVFAGTLVVYNVDRLRDLERDRASAPLRTAFVERHELVLTLVCWVGAGVAVFCGLAVGAMAVLALVPVGLLGFFHRRAKRYSALKAAYITLAWLMVVVAFPAVAAAEAHSPAAVAWVLGLGLLANALASNVDAPGSRGLALARGVAVLGVLSAFLAPAGVWPLASVPLAVAWALVRFEPEERHRLIVLDGALLWGGLAAFLVAPLVHGG